MDFWEELWTEYRELAKSLVGVVVELIGIFFVIKVGGWLIHGMNVQPSCNANQWIDCAHTVALLTAWVGLTLSFVFIAAVFTYRHTVRRMQDIGQAEALRDTRAYTAAITAAASNLEPGAHDSDRTRAIQTLLGLRDKYPTDRYLSLYLGRLYKAREDYESASDAMSFFISAKGSKTDNDFADLLFNRACYRALHATRLEGDAKAACTTVALDDLEKSIRLSRDNADAARADTDFVSLRNNERFVALIRVQ